MYCGRCFSENLVRRVRREIRRGRLLKRGKRVAFAVSGGKDSIACLDIVHPIAAERRTEMSVVCIDEGVGDYRARGIEIAREAARSRGLEFHLFSFKEEIGEGIDSILELAGSKEVSCTYCGVLRRWLLNRVAGELGADVMVTGHTLDDEAQSALLNLIRGDPARIARSGPEYVVSDPRFVPRVKPLRRIPCRETLLYDLFRGLDFHLEKCPYAKYDMRNEIRRFLNGLEEGRPTSKSSLLSSMDRISLRLNRTYGDVELKACSICGQPTGGEMCKACRLLKSVDLLRDA